MTFKAVVIRHLCIILCLVLQADLSIAVTILDNAESGFAMVQVKGAMWGSGMLALIKNDKTNEGDPGEFELAVITPSHLIQNNLNPVVQVTPRNGLFLTGSIHDAKSIAPQFVELKSKDIPASVLFQDALRDIALLKLSLSSNDPLYLSLFDIARKNLVLCEDEDADSSCFQLKEFYSAIKVRSVFSQNINWILNGKVVSQPLNKENEGASISVVKDQYISGLFERIFALSVYGGPGMSGGGFYLNDNLAGMISKVHYDGYPEVYAIPMNQIYKTLLCSYWKNEDCKQEDIRSRWVSEGNQQFLIVNYKGVQLKQIVAPIPLGFAGSPITVDSLQIKRPLSIEDLKSKLGNSALEGSKFELEKIKNKFDKIAPSMRSGPGVVGSGGGPGVVGSGGKSKNPYIYIHHLPGAELMESTGTPLVNPFSLSENNFSLNQERYCGLKLSDTQLDLAPNIPRFILMTEEATAIQSKSCSKGDNSKQKVKYSQPTKARYFFLNRQLTSEYSLHYDFMESGFKSYTQLSPSSVTNSDPLNVFSPVKPAFLDSVKFTYNSDGCLNTFPIALCRMPEQNSTVLFKARVSFMLDPEDRYHREMMEVEFSANLDSITLRKYSSKRKLENSTILKKHKTTASSISFANENQTTKAVLNFSDQDQAQPFNLFIQTPKLLLQFEW